MLIIISYIGSLIVMNNDNKPPSYIKFSKHLDRKLHSYLEWPYLLFVITNPLWPCMCACKCVCVCVRACVCVCARACVCVCLHAPICMYVCMCVLVFASEWVCDISMHTYFYVATYAHVRVFLRYIHVLRISVMNST